MTTTPTAILAIASGLVVLAAMAPAHAASQSVMMSSQTFQNRCLTQNGLFAGGGDNFGCQVDGVTVECTFFAAGADCEWTGKTQQAIVVRLLGIADTQPVAGNEMGSKGVKDALRRGRS